ncbi:glycosyl hydrolase [Mucilaginibacter sp. HC2]|uniref:glycoside hydrolase n=1 Tax=Mucilaginibacter inviolabilis TaxID=2714892 RepID=UPI00140D75F0|nr:glycoside hydrolase [Mucilaginibacter inviolabilis]NHA03221.1 glycosyl hydrolase [Mucilaginibacter inviolabilis]
MKNNKLQIAGLAMLAAILAGSCKKGTLEEVKTSKSKSLVTAGTTSASITFNWDKTYQTIDGFGCFGGRVTPFFESAKRDTIMAYLWGNQGLQLNIIRGEILYTYPFDKSSGVVTIKPSGADINVDVTSSAYTSLTDDQKEQLAQLWIMKTVKSKYQVPVMFASAWTPPLAMKTNPNSVNAQWFNGLNFNTSSTDFARYIAGFAKAFQSEGVNFSAVSPTNEPENIFSSWAASYWDAAHLGQFVSNNLRPALNEKGLNSVKIIASENAAWDTANGFLSGMDKSNVDILAGHGYVGVVDAILGKKGLNQTPSAWTFSTGGKPVWLTETSDAGVAYDNTMGEGLKLATSMHNFLTTCNVNAFVYWLGMLAGQDNEALINKNSDGSLDIAKTYDVMGQFSRYVRPGYVRFDANVQNDSSLKVSAFKDPSSGKFSIVAVNTGNQSAVCTLQLQGFTAATLNSYLTADSNNHAHWLQGIPVTANPDGSISVTVPALSVTTFTGVKGQ